MSSKIQLKSEVFSFLCFISCFSIIITSNAQDWTNINPSFDPPGNYSMSNGTFVDEYTGWSAEFYPGRICKTTDSGLNWVLQKDSSGVWIYDIEFINTLHGWVLGEKVIERSHFLWRTTDGGNSWEEISIPGLYITSFFDSCKGFAGGDSIYLTTDGGESWQPQTIEPGARFGVTDIYFVDEKYGWAVGISSEIIDAGIILNTTDGGQTWQVHRHPTLSGSSIYFLNRHHGCIVGDLAWGEAIMMTQDGGENWNFYYPGSPVLRDVVFTDDNTGWTVGDYGSIWYTGDGGKTWEQVESGTSADLNRIVFVEDGTVGYIFGSDNTLLKYERTIGDIEIEYSVTPSMFKLNQNYPNPFNPETSIQYSVVSDQSLPHVTLKIYNVLGHEVQTLMNEQKEPGYYTATWDGKDYRGKDVSSGVYFYCLQAGDFMQTKKMVLMR